MNSIRLVFCTASCVSLLVIMVASHAEEADGYETYVKFQCHQCHGHKGQGGKPGGPRIVALNYSFEAFAARTRHTNIMPAYSSEVLGDVELRTIYEYISSVPEPPDIEEIPMLRDAHEDLEKQ